VTVGGLYARLIESPPRRRPGSIINNFSARIARPPARPKFHYGGAGRGGSWWRRGPARDRATTPGT